MMLVMAGSELAADTLSAFCGKVVGGGLKNKRESEICRIG